MTIKPSSEITSPIEVQTILVRLAEWRSLLRQGQIKTRLHLQMAPSADPSLVSDLRKLGIRKSIDTVENIEAVSTAITSWLATTPRVHLTFPAPMAPANRRVVMDWLHQQIHPGILAEFKVDGTIATGFVLRTKNRIYNFTSNQTLWQHRGKISELVRHV